MTHAYCWPEVRRGGERFTQMLGAALVRRGHEVTILSSGFKPSRTVLDGVTTIRLRRVWKHPYRHEADFGRRVIPSLLTKRYDVVHSLGRRDAVAAIRSARFSNERRTVFTDLGAPDIVWWESVGAAEARAVRRVVEEIEVYSCMSRWALGFLERDYGRTDGVVIPGGVSLSEFIPAPSRTAHPTLLFSGAFQEKRKGMAVLLEALPMIATVEPQVELWVSGPGDAGSLLAEAPEAARKHVKILDLGDPRNQRDRYGRAWATALPSTNDSFGMALVESLACGTPLVVTSNGAPKELVDPGVTGEICEPNDPRSLAAACLRAFDLARRSETVEVCRSSARPFGWDEGLAPLCEAVYEV